MGDFLKARPAEGEQPLQAQDLQGDQLVRDFPCLFEYLTLTRWEDGTARVPSSLTLFLDEGRLKACLHDRDMGRVAFVAGWAPVPVLRALEEGLLEGTVEWRPSRSQGGKPGRK